MWLDQDHYKELEKNCVSLLMLEPSGYWETHYDFGTGGARKTGTDWQQSSSGHHHQ